MEREPLPPDPPSETQVSITGDPGRQSEEHPDVIAQLAYEAKHPIIVPDHLRRPHHLVTNTRAILQHRKPGTNGTLWTKGCPLQIRVSPNQVARALRIFDSFVKACEERGFSVSAGDERDARTKIKVRGEELAVSIEEPSRRTDHVLTAREKEEHRQGRGWSIPRYDYGPSGRLVFTINEWTEGVRHRWSDREKRPLEACLNDIIVGLVRISVMVLGPRRTEVTRRHQLWLEEERGHQIHRARMEALRKCLEEWQQNQELRAFIAAVEAAARSRCCSTPEETPLREWLRWARDLADRGDPLNNFIDQLGRHETLG
jgi:hypothetical protein